MISSRELEQIERYINPNKQRANLSAYVTVECYADEEEFRNKFQQQGWTLGEDIIVRGKTYTYQTCNRHTNCPKTRRIVRSDFPFSAILLEERIDEEHRMPKRRRACLKNIPTAAKEFMRNTADLVGCKGTSRQIWSLLMDAVSKGHLPVDCLLMQHQVDKFVTLYEPHVRPPPPPLTDVELLDASLDAYRQTSLPSSTVNISYTM